MRGIVPAGPLARQHGRVRLAPGQGAPARISRENPARAISRTRDLPREPGAGDPS
ncbi:hypothetical protein [Streptomyces sp. NPDC007088]|uniref:hypothetical protein n=1 Tax=Streptomyces sp. NPDC007088 TaxID=3364773 RepID=UPI0036A888B3